MAERPQSEEALLQTLQETAETGLFTQQLGEFLTGTVPPFHLFQFLAGLNILPEDAQRQFLQLLQTFETETPGVQQVSFVPQGHHQTIVAAMQNLMLNTEDFHAGMEISDDVKKYSITAIATVESVQSIKHNSPLRHPSDFSAATQQYIETQLPSPISTNPFYARREHANFMRSKPFVRITVENKAITQMTVGFGLPPVPGAGHAPIPMTPR